MAMWMGKCDWGIYLPIGLRFGVKLQGSYRAQLKPEANVSGGSPSVST